MTDPVNDEAQAWLDQTRVLLKASQAKSTKSQRQGLDKEVKALNGVMDELKVASGVRHARFVPQHHAVADTAVKAARLANEGALKAATDALHKLVETLKAEIKAQKDLISDAAKFGTEYAKLEIEVAETSGLRGARTPGTAVHTRLATASEFMQAAADKRVRAQAEASNALIKEAMASLEMVKTKLADAKKDAKSVDTSNKDYLAAITEWGLLAPKARDVLRQMRELAGAEDLADELQNHLGTAMGGIKNVDGVFTGHDAAVRLVGDVDARLAKAKVAHAAHLAKTLPQLVLKARTAADVDIAAHAALVPSYLAKAVRDEAATLTESGRHDINAAVNGLAAMQTRLQQATADLQRDKTTAEAAVAKFNTTVASLVQLDVPAGLYAGLKRAGDAAQAGEFADSQWAAATGRLDNATLGLQQIETRYTTLGPDWKRRKTELEGIRKEAVALASFPAVRQAAVVLRDKADEVLALFVGGDLQTAIDAHKKAVLGKQTLAQARDDLNKQAQAKGVPVGSGTGAPLDEATRLAFIKGLNDAITAVRTASENAHAALLKHIQNNTTLAAAERRLLLAHWTSLVGQVETDWLAFHQASNGDLKALDKQAKSAVAALAKLVKDQTQLKPKELEGSLRTLEQDDAKAFKADMPRQIEHLIGLLEATGENVAPARKALADALALTQPQSALINVAGSLRKQLDAKEQALAEARQASRGELITKIAKPLKNLGISKVYQNELQKDCQDTLAMIDTQDADLLEAAQARLTRQAALITKIGADPGLYEDNQRKLKALGARLAKMADVLPDSYRALQTDLTKLFVDSKHTDPMSLSKTVMAFDIRVDEKETEAAVRQREIKALYDPLKKQIEALWKKRSEVVGDVLGIGSGFFPKEFEAYKDARLAEAGALKATETPIASVVQPLQALKDKLDLIEAAPNSKAAIEQLNADELANQRLVRDMAAQFEREVKAFKEGTLAQAKAATKTDVDGDGGLANSLSGVASAAAKMVSPYLKLLGTWPHETKGSQPSPDMQRMKQDFERARTMLAEAERTARRLIDTPTTTNVTGPSKDGLRKLLPKWGERCLGYAAAVRTMAAAIRSAAASEADPVNQQAAEKAAVLIEGVGGSFRADAFAASFAGLMTTATDKADIDKLDRLHKARREDALRIMREYRTELTENRLRRLLTDASQNPFEAATLMAAAGALRVTLKEIELQVLDSV